MRLADGGSRWIVISLLAACWWTRAVAAAEDPAALELFEKSIRPVLVETCLKCHDAEKHEGNLRLDTRANALRGGDTAPALVPEQPEKSLLLTALKQTGDVQMPPSGKLKDEQIAAFERWIKLGAPWPSAAPLAQKRNDAARTHWAFQPVRDPAVPKIAGNALPPIDAFVRTKLLAAGLAPASRADRRTLIRRATFDLLGLPPTPEDVAAFVGDPDPKAYEKLIDRLLTSPHYGEQWGRHWLDVARYSDTKGYVYARENRIWVHAWAYRDWVVKSLNDDMPYDRFLLYQIAADQLAGDDKRHLAAMGFLTLNRRFLGVTHDIIDDRIDVVTRGTMGLTVACARCHDHKYDPIPTADYYSLYGVFQNCRETQLPIAEPAQRDAAYDAFAKELAKREEKLATLLLQRRTEASARVRDRIGDYLMATREMHKYPEEGFDQVLAKNDIIPAFVRRWQAYLMRTEREGDPVFIAWHEFGKLADDADFRTKAEVVRAKLLARTPAEFHPLVAERFSTPVHSHLDVATRYGLLFAELDVKWQKAAADAGTSLDEEALRRVLYGEGAPCEIPNEPIVNIEMFFDLGACEELWRTQGEVDRWLIQSSQAPAYAVVLEDRGQQVSSYVHKRGKASNKGPEVPRQFLSLLAGKDHRPFKQGSGRLELAKAIVEPSNPLTYRVLVNRVWLHHFGQGLVRSPSDFGTRAEAPSHPELLDWLTSRFIEEGMSLKKLHRRIMLSETYQQASVLPAERAQAKKPMQVDPENRLLWRMNQRRLTFEELRDQFYAATGELSLELGGKPADLFAGGFKRRTLYGQIDRQFLPSTLRVFDFANPDLHIPQRSDTTVPQQALFFLNHDMLLGRAQALAKRLPADAAPEERVQRVFQFVYQRPATPQQVTAALALVQAKVDETADEAPVTAAEWQYGFGGFDDEAKRTKGFTKLPYFTGAAWQGGYAWPDARLGWVQLTAEGGHAGNDVEHAAVRRWTAPRDMRVNIASLLVHDTTAGDGVQGRLISSRQGLVHEAKVHNSRAEFNASLLELKAGDTLDFAVDIGGTLNNDQFVWEVKISAADAQIAWNSRTDFLGPRTTQLNPWEQLAQVLFSTNEFMFVD